MFIASGGKIGMRLVVFVFVFFCVYLIYYILEVPTSFGFHDIYFIQFFTQFVFSPIYFAIFLKGPITDRITEDKTTKIILSMSTKTENCAYCTNFFFLISLDNKLPPQMLFYRSNSFWPFLKTFSEQVI